MGCVLQHTVPGAILGSELLLRLDVPVADCDGVELVGADAPRVHFDGRLGGVEGPFAIGADHGNRKRPVFVADGEDCPVGVRGRDFETVFGMREAREFGLLGAILSGVARGEDCSSPRSENGRQPRGVVVGRRIDDRLGSSLRRIEALLRD